MKPEDIMKNVAERLKLHRNKMRKMTPEQRKKLMGDLEETLSLSRFGSLLHSTVLAEMDIWRTLEAIERLQGREHVEYKEPIASFTERLGRTPYINEMTDHIKLFLAEMVVNVVRYNIDWRIETFEKYNENRNDWIEIEGDWKNFHRESRFAEHATMFGDGCCAVAQIARSREICARSIEARERARSARRFATDAARE